MKRQLIIYIVMCSLLLTACSTDDGTTTNSIPSGTQPVMFGAMMDTGKATTRSLNELSDATLKSGSGFGVFGCYTGLHYYSDSNVNPDFMYNEQVRWNTDKWTYTPLKYWPNGEGEVSGNTGSEKHYVSFMAYAPYSDNANGPSGYCISSFSKQGEIGNPWLTYRLIDQANLSDQVDLLYASHTDDHPILDQTKPENPNSKVMFHFDHALACAGNQVTINCDQGIKNQLTGRINATITNTMVVVTGIQIEYTLTSKARLVLWNQGEPNWQAIFSEEPTTNRTVTILDPENQADDVPVWAYVTNIPSTITIQNTWTGNGIFYIPIELSGYAQTATVIITHRIATYSGSSWKYDAEKIGTATVNLKDYQAAYQAGKHLYFNVTLNQVDIALTAAIVPWTTITQEVEGVED